MHPVLFETDFFGLLSEPFALHTYGLMIATGFLVAMQLAARQAGREGEDPDRINDLAFFVLLAGLIGARIVFILTKFDTYTSNPVEILKFWKGGLVWYGGFIGAALYVLYYSKKHSFSFFKLVDIMIPYMALAHTFGRFGCLAAGCCYGEPTSLPWGISFPDHSMAHSGQITGGIVDVGEHAVPIHPTQLYEAGAELAMFWILINLRKIKRFHGQLFLVWLSAYPIIRSVIEMFRGDKERGVYFLGLSTSQIISFGVASVAIALALYFYRQRRASAGAMAAA